ncbi:hypothetical protein GGR34_003339 [Microvirga flocculans]|uniref:TniQ domain-containing protein n=1 Tax=Microvirga flocculans TaxID=217168 RepID=A0A7W6IHN9_9HYPH|nr:TniQ family protein [Microvirga flocculans]MBB4041661.1 hypothetical protein [Microvirga flocculans]
MDTIRPVLFPLESFPDESLAGLMGRVAAHNNYDEPSWIVAVLKAPAALYKWSEADVRAASAILDIPEDEVAQRVYLRVGGERRFFCHAVDERVLERKTYKHCPDCLEERGYHSGVFDLKAIQACPLHLRRLVRACPVCNKSYNRSRPLLTCSGCSVDIRFVPRIPIAPERLRGTAMIALAAGFPKVHPDLAEICAVPPGLSHLSLSQLIEAAVVLGAYAGFRGLSPQYGYGQTHEDVGRIIAQLQEGAEALRDWPAGLSPYINERITAKKRTGHSSGGIRELLGGFWQFLVRHDHEPWATVRSAIAKYAVVEWDGILTRGNTITGPMHETERPYLSFSEFGERLGRPRHLRHLLIEARIIKVGTRKQHSRYIAVDRASVDEICPPGKPLLGFNEVKRRLGIKDRIALRLVEDRVIEPLLGPVCAGARKTKLYYFTHSEVERLITSLNSGWRPRREDPGKTWNFSRVMATMTRDYSAKTLVAAIASGEIAPLAQIPEGAGLDALLFDADEASRFMAGIRKLNAEGEWVTLRWIRDNLGFHVTVTLGLVAGGHIRAAPHARREIRVDKASAKTFHEKWVSVQSVAKENGSAPRVMARMLQKIPDLETIRATDTPLCLFYRRDQLDALPIKDMILTFQRSRVRSGE